MPPSRTRLPRLCVGRSVARVVRSPSVRSKSISDFIGNEQKEEFLGEGEGDGDVMGGFGDGDGEDGQKNGNKVMVVVDSSLEARGALEWTLTHTVQNQDTIVLLYVSKPSKKGGDSDLKAKLRAHEVLYSMKSMCQKKRPGVLVVVAMHEGKEKGPIIVEEASKQKVSLLVLGQKKRSAMRLVVQRWWAGRSRSRREAAEYCIQNASCMTIAVRRKGKKLGGYLITTKRHKNFWLLA